MRKQKRNLSIQSKENQTSLPTFQQRRSFFKKAFGLLGVAAVLPSLMSTLAVQTANAEERRRPKKAEGGSTGGDLDLPIAKPGQGIAAGISYQTEHSAVKDATLKTVRQGIGFDQQFCSGCMLYTAAGKKDGKEVGKCQLFQKELVSAKGWCASWAKKA